MIPDRQSRFIPGLQSAAAVLSLLEREAPDAEMCWDMLAGAVYWSDEIDRHALSHESVGALRPVLRHRTCVMLDIHSPFGERWDIARSMFPKWVGFSQHRCRPSPEVLEKARVLMAGGARKVEELFGEEHP